MKVLKIYEDENNDLVTTVEEVLRQLERGNTSGIDPSWKIENE